MYCKYRKLGKQTLWSSASHDNVSAVGACQCLGDAEVGKSVAPVVQRLAKRATYPNPRAIPALYELDPRQLLPQAPAEGYRHCNKRGSHAKVIA